MSAHSGPTAAPYFSPYVPQSYFYMCRSIYFYRFPVETMFLFFPMHCDVCMVTNEKRAAYVPPRSECFRLNLQVSLARVVNPYSPV